MRPRLAAAVIATAVCAGYYFGSILGLLLRLPPATPSIIWPPNAILTAALLLVPPRRWWLVLLPVLPVHVVVQLPTGWPLTMVLALFLTNCAEAIVTAGTVWWLSDAPPRFDTPRQLSTFFLAVLAATAISGFLDAAAVTWFLEEVLDGLEPALLQQHPRATDDCPRAGRCRVRLAAVGPVALVEAARRGSGAGHWPDGHERGGFWRRPVPASATSRGIESGPARAAAAVSPVGGRAVRHAGRRGDALHRDDSGCLVRGPRSGAVRGDVTHDNGSGAHAVAHPGCRDGSVAGRARPGTAGDTERARRAAGLRGDPRAPLWCVRSGSERPHGRWIRRVARTHRHVPRHQVRQALRALGARSDARFPLRMDTSRLPGAAAAGRQARFSLGVQPARALPLGRGVVGRATSRPRRATTCARCSGTATPRRSSCRSGQAIGRLARWRSGRLTNAHGQTRS